jgi:hypothetical protein
VNGPRTPGTLRTSLAATFAVAVMLSGCRTFGPGLPVCGELATTGTGEQAHLTVTDAAGETLPLRTAHLMQLQAVPTADRGLCVDELPRGWQAAMDEPRSGAATLWFASTGLGGRFLDVQLTASCAPPEEAHRTTSGSPGVKRWVQVHEESRRIRLTIVPVAERHRQQAWDTAVSLIGRELRGSSLRIDVVGTDKGPVGSRIEAALAGGSSVLVIDDTVGLDDMLELRIAGLERPIMGSLGEVLAQLGERAPPPRYAATWWEASAQGCVVYRFDATGPEVVSLEDDASRAVGEFPLDALRRGLVDLGHDLEVLDAAGATEAPHAP